MDRVGIGIIGCGTISEAYLQAASHFPILEIMGLADIRSEAADARASKFGLKAVSVDELLRDPSVEIIVNLTIPAAHVEVGLKALSSGKHVHSEKPLGTRTEEALKLVRFAKERGLRVGCAPDTFLGGSHQTCRKLIDEGAIGRPVAGSAFFMCPGHERWHPSPAFYYGPGGGPMLDMGPYYITALVNLIGAVARVSGSATRIRPERTITSEPLKGTRIPVEVATHVAGTLEFVCGATVSIAMSFDVPRHRHAPIELYGTDASLIVPDPNRFGGAIELAKAGQDWVEQPIEHLYADGNYRVIGIADLAHAIRTGRPHRASGDLALHVLVVCA
jgi:predicted dehydrogenase